MDTAETLKEQMRGLTDKYSILEILEAFYEVTGVNRSAKQIEFATKRMYELAVEDTLWEKWSANNHVTYTVNDFPLFVIDTMATNGMPDANAVVAWLYDKHARKSINTISDFFNHRGKMYFNENGYRWIISNSLRWDMVNEEDYPEWQRQSGLFAHINDFSFGS